MINCVWIVANSRCAVLFCQCVFDDGATGLSHLLSGMIQVSEMLGDGASASWWSGSAGGHVPEATQDSSAATACYGSAEDTVWTRRTEHLWLTRRGARKSASRLWYRPELLTENEARPTILRRSEC